MIIKNSCNQTRVKFNITLLKIQFDFPKSAFNPKIAFIFSITNEINEID